MWAQLPNSGETLKLLIPSYSRKGISGQNNYLGKVTSQKIDENQMGDRGSKSEIQSPQPNVFSVKEQRVDGSYFGFIPKLRCTLMAFERKYQIKVLSKQLKKRNFCSTQVHLSRLDPWFVTGFCDGEASFSPGVVVYLYL